MRALIIDDEEAVRAGLSAHIAWQQLGFDEVATAATAEEALARLEEERPELIISDIRLPGMDGIALCRIIRERNIQCRIIFISGYFNREYVKGALELAAEDYIEKPIRIPEMEKAVKKAAARIDGDHRRRLQYEETEAALKAYFQKCRRDAVQELLRGRWASEIIGALPAQLWPFREEDSFILLLVKMMNPDQMFTLSDVMKRIGQPLEKERFLSEEKTEDTGIFVVARRSDGENSLAHFSAALQWNLEKQTCAKRIACVMSDPAQRLTDVPRQYFQVNEQLRKAFFCGFGKLITSKLELKEIPFDRQKIPYEAFQQALLDRNREKAQELAAQMAEYLRRCSKALPDLVRMVFFEWNQLLLSSGREEEALRSTDPGRETPENYQWQKIRGFETIDACYEDLRGNLESFFRDQDRYYQDNALVNRAVLYISQHYGSGITVKEVADEVGMTPGYFTAIFRDATGSTLGSYLKEIRLTKAAEYLEKTQLSLKEISERCGYSDPNYFAKAFKKSYGMIPSEYRSRKKG